MDAAPTGRIGHRVRFDVHPPSRKQSGKGGGATPEQMLNEEDGPAPDFQTKK